MDSINLLACLWQWLFIALWWHSCVVKTSTFICTWLCNIERYFLLHEFVQLFGCLFYISLYFLFFLRSELSGRCPSSNSSPTAEEEWCVQVRNAIMKCSQLWTMAQECIKWMCGNKLRSGIKRTPDCSLVWEQLQLMSCKQQIQERKFIQYLYRKLN